MLRHLNTGYLDLRCVRKVGLEPARTQMEGFLGSVLANSYLNVNRVRSHLSTEHRAKQRPQCWRVSRTSTDGPFCAAVGLRSCGRNLRV